jgi:cytochrome c biogenesis protein CcdA
MDRRISRNLAAIASASAFHNTYAYTFVILRGMKTANYRIMERALKWIIVLLLVEFILGVLLTTVIDFQPHKHSALQTIVLISHIIIGIALIAGSIAHAITSRKSHLLGLKPLKGIIFILTAFIAGGISVDNGNSWAVLVMALGFGAAITNYGLSYIKVKDASTSK